MFVRSQNRSAVNCSVLFLSLKNAFFLLQKLDQQRKNQYDLLKQRIEREKSMFVIAQKIQTRKDLLVRDLTGSLYLLLKSLGLALYLSFFHLC